MSSRTLVRLASLGALLGAWLPGGDASAYRLRRTEAGAPVAWQGMPVPYVIDAAGGRDLSLDRAEALVRRSFQAWAEVEGSRVSFDYRGRIAAAEPGYDTGRTRNENLVIWQQTAWQHEPEALAVTLLVYEVDTGAMLDADIVVNEAVHRFGTGEVDRMDFQSTLTHEVGHLLGLAHSEAADATMFASLLPGETRKRILDADDLTALQVSYPPQPWALDDAPPAPGSGAARRNDAVGPPTQPDPAGGAERPPTPLGCALAPAGEAQGLGTVIGLALLLLGLALARARPAGLVAGILLAAGTGAPAHATIAIAHDLESLTTRASLIVEGRVIDVAAAWEGRLIYTTALVEVERCHKGACLEAIVTLRVLGGEVDGVRMAVAGMARFQLEESVLLFLEPVGAIAPGAYRTTGLAQGKFHLSPAGQDRVAHRSLEGLRLIGAQQGAARALRLASLEALITRLEAHRWPIGGHR